MIIPDFSVKVERKGKQGEDVQFPQKRNPNGEMLRVPA